MCTSGLFHKSRELEGLVRAAFLHSFQTFGRNGDGDFLTELGDEKGFGLEIHLAAARAGRVEFGRTRTIRIPPADLGFFTCDIADASHMWAQYTQKAANVQTKSWRYTWIYGRGKKESVGWRR